MGKFFTDSSDRVRIDFPDGEWVEVKEELSQADSDYILNEMAKTQVEGKTAKVELNLGQLCLLERSILSWSFVNGTGAIMPVTRDAISQLRNRYRAKLAKEINRLNAEAMEFVQKN